MYLLDYEEKVQNLKSPDKKTMKNTAELRLPSRSIHSSVYNVIIDRGPAGRVSLISQSLAGLERY